MHKQQQQRDWDRSRNGEGSRHHPASTSRQSSQNGHPFAVPTEKSRADREVGGRASDSRFLPRVTDRSSYHDYERDERNRAMSLSPANSRKSTGAHSHISRSSTGSSIAFPPLLTPSPPFSGYNSGNGGGNQRTPEMISAYDELIRTALRQYTDASANIGADVYRQSELVEDLFHIQREFLVSSCGQERSPSAGGSGPDQANKIKAIKAMAKQKSVHPAHLQFISDTIGCMGWVVMGSKPCAFIRESYDKGKKNVKDIKAYQKEYSTGKEHSEWIKSWQEVVLDLEAFVNKYHPYGLVWRKG